MAIFTISTSEIEKILYDKATFNKFIRKTKQFAKIDINVYLQKINKYIEFLIKNNDNIPKSVFDSINYINDYFKYNKSYSYEDYLNSTKSIITLNTLINILKDKSTFKRFLDFENNISFFGNLSIEQYISALDNMVNHYRDNNIDIPSKHLKRYLIIKKTYFGKNITTNINPEKITLEDIDGYTPFEEVNTKLKERVLKGLDLNEDKLLLAKQIYINLCKVLKYDISFAHLYSYHNKEKSDAIYNKSIEEIDLQNTDIICKSWAELYAKLLIDIGIDAKVVGKRHKYVSFLYDDLLIEADATESKKDEINDSMNDLTRIKLGIIPIGFTSFNNKTKFSILINNVDKKIENIGKSAIQNKVDLISYYNSITNKEVSISLEERLTLLNNLAKEVNIKDLEYLAYFKRLSKIILCDMEDYMDLSYIITYSQTNKYIAGIILTLEKNRKTNYYMFNKESNWRQLTKEEIQYALLNGNITTLFSDINIPGIWKEKKNERTR